MAMRLLLIEDDLTVARGIVAMLKPYGMAVETVDTGEEGRERALTAAYDLILLDMMLPDMGGHEVLRRLRAADISTPVLVLSGHATPQTKVLAFNLGADEFMAKPFDRDELVARIKAVLRRTKGLAKPTLTLGALNIELGSQKVSVHGQDIRLTGREYGILELLAMRKGTVLTKDAFMAHLYSGMDEPEAKIIDVFICKLRKKLADAGADNLIGTVWGRGYVMRDPALATGYAFEPDQRVMPRAA
jgi:two-component system cell cycle response regulator CtrA